VNDQRAGNETQWCGTPTTLLAVLEQIAGIDPKFRPKNWPKDATRLSGKLNVMDLQIRSRGFVHTTDIKNNKRLIKICKIR
jgi:hypothetical protein